MNFVNTDFASIPFKLAGETRTLQGVELLERSDLNGADAKLVTILFYSVLSIEYLHFAIYMFDCESGA
jgi:hypothetical protein